MEKKDQIYRPRSTMMINNFLGGIAWGVGSVLGATLIISVIGLLLAQFKGVPIIGNTFESISLLLKK